MVNSNEIDTFSRFSRVSRETISSLTEYEKMLLEANKNLNLIGKSTINSIQINTEITYIKIKQSWTCR